MKEHRRDIAHIQCERGLEALDRGAPDEARASFEAALRKQADLFDARLGLARAKEALGDDGAEAEYRHATLLEPEHPEPMIGRARLGLAALVAMVGPSFWEDGHIEPSSGSSGIAQRGPRTSFSIAVLLLGRGVWW